MGIGRDLRELLLFARERSPTCVIHLIRIIIGIKVSINTYKNENIYVIILRVINKKPIQDLLDGFLGIEIRSFYLDQVKLFRFLGQFDEVFDVQLLHEIKPVNLCGPFADLQYFGDVVVSLAIQDQFKNLFFPVGQ
jgi:hypothetical protein